MAFQKVLRGFVTRNASGGIKKSIEAKLLDYWDHNGIFMGFIYLKDDAKRFDFQ